MGNLMRRSAKRLSCLFCRRQNAAGERALWARKRHAVGVPFRLIEFALQIPARRPLTLKILNESKSGGVYLGFLTLRGRKFPHGNFRTSVFCEVRTHLSEKRSFSTVTALLRSSRAAAACRTAWRDGRSCRPLRRSGDPHQRRSPLWRRWAGPPFRRPAGRGWRAWPRSRS